MRFVGLCVCLAALAFPAAVLADGDPASDYLIVADTYLPYPPPPAAVRAGLSDALVSVRKAHGRVKVAVIVPGLAYVWANVASNQALSPAGT